VVDALEVPIDGKDALSAAERRHVKVKALEIIALQFLHEPMQTGLKAVNSLVPISCVLYINYCTADYVQCTSAKA
jgi:F-type H+-transporting ATPase subunit alpha